MDRRIPVPPITELQYQQLLGLTTQPLGILQDGRYVLCNEAAIRLTGYSEEELYSMPARDLVNPEERDAAEEIARRRLEIEGYNPTALYRVLRKDGTRVHVQVSGVRIVWCGGFATLNFLSDVTERVEAEAALRASEARFRLLAENTVDVIWIHDLDHRKFTYFSPSVTALLGYSPEEALRLSLADLVEPAMLEQVQDDIAWQLEHFRANPTYEGHLHQSRWRRKDGTSVWVEVSTKYRRAEGGGIESIGVGRAIEARMRAEEEIRSLATRDALTGLYNRYFLDGRVPEEMERADRYDDPLSLVLFDIDRFKDVNDRFGHPVGDDVLQWVSRMAGSVLRESDTFARYGGEEFVVVMPNTSAEGARAAAEKMRAALEERPHPVVGRVTASFGVVSRIRSESYKSWFRRLDDAMYRAKEEGRNRVAVAEDFHGRSFGTVQFEWKSRWESHDPLIDAQHREMLDAVNDLLQQLLERPDAKETREAQQVLVDGMARHFDDEVAVLAKWNYPGTADMKADHDRLLARTRQLQTEYLAGRARGTTFFSFLIDEFIVGHMLHEDAKFFPFLRGIYAKEDRP